MLSTFPMAKCLEETLEERKASFSACFFVQEFAGRVHLCIYLWSSWRGRWPIETEESMLNFDHYSYKQSHNQLALRWCFTKYYILNKRRFQVFKIESNTEKISLKLDILGCTFSLSMFGTRLHSLHTYWHSTGSSRVSSTFDVYVRFTWYDKILFHDERKLSDSFDTNGRVTHYKRHTLHKLWLNKTKVTIQ